MRLSYPALTAALTGAAVLLGVPSCGQIAPHSAEDRGVPAAPTYGLLQTERRMVHWITDRREGGGNTVQAEVAVYDNGDVEVIANLTAAATDGVRANPTALIDVRLSDSAQATLERYRLYVPYCDGLGCQGTRQYRYNYKLAPGLAPRVANVWLTLEIPVQPPTAPTPEAQ